MTQHPGHPDPATSVVQNPVFSAAPALPRTATARERHVVLDRPPEKPDLTRRVLEVNRFAVLAFVLGLFGGGLLAVVLAVVSLRQIRETGDGGRALAIAAVVLSAVWTVVLLVRLGAGGS